MHPTPEEQAELALRFPMPDRTDGLRGRGQLRGGSGGGALSTPPLGTAAARPFDWLASA